MAITINKQRLLTQLLAVQRESESEPLPVLQQFIFALCRENATREQAELAYKNLCEQFFDWNEIRVSAVRELEEALAGLDNTEHRAERIIAFLQEVFETTFSFDLESLHKKGVKQAAKHLSHYNAANEYTCSWVVQRTLGGHAIPVDAPTLRCARRIGLIEAEQADGEAVRSALEHLIPKAKGAQFTDAISQVAEDHCWEDEPNCSQCPLAGECPSAQMLDATPTERNGRVKPR